MRDVLSLGVCGDWCPFSLWAGDQILRDNPLATFRCLHDRVGVKCVVVMLIVVLHIIQMIKYRILLCV